MMLKEYNSFILPKKLVWRADEKYSKPIDQQDN